MPVGGGRPGRWTLRRPGRPGCRLALRGSAPVTADRAAGGKRREVAGGVPVPVARAAAWRTAAGALRQRPRRLHGPARPAGLRGRVPAVHAPVRPPVPVALVLRQGGVRPPCRRRRGRVPVSGGAASPRGAGSRLHRAAALGNGRGGLMVVVARTGDTGRRPSPTGVRGFPPMGRAARAVHLADADAGPVEAPQFGRVLLPGARGDDVRPLVRVPRRGQRLAARVAADGRVRTRGRRDFAGVRREGDGPAVRLQAAGMSPAQGRGFRHAHPADGRPADPDTVHRERVAPVGRREGTCAGRAGGTGKTRPGAEAVPASATSGGRPGPTGPCRRA